MAYQLRVRKGISMIEIIAQVDRSQSNRFARLSEGDQENVQKELIEHFRRCRDHNLEVEASAIRECIESVLAGEDPVP